MTFYGTPATGAGWIVPKNYILKVGDTRIQQHPIGLGPYRVSHQPGVKVIFEANTDYWRKTPHVKRLVRRRASEATTRLAMLKKQEADVAYGIMAPSPRRSSAIELEAGEHLSLRPSGSCSPMTNTILSPRGPTNASPGS